MKLLINFYQAESIKKALEKEFPQLEIITITNEKEAEPYTEETQILMSSRASDEFVKKAVKLEWVQSLISGTEFFTDLPSLRKDIIITSCKGIHGPQMAETAFLLMLSLNRRYYENVLNQEKCHWEPWPTRLLYQKSVGILGVGVIGKEVARKCKAFDMTVLGLTSTKREIENVDFSFGPDQLSDIFKQSDYIINILPNTPTTRNIIGKELFATMKPDAYFVNIGRGETVDEAALMDALTEGKFAGAGLDVFPQEPLPKDSPFWKMKNVIITPHVGGRSDVYAQQSLPILKENLRRYLQGERENLINLVKRDR